MSTQATDAQANATTTTADANAQVLYRTDGPMAVLTINRPDKMNALNAGLIQELGVLLQQAIDDEAIYGVVVTGQGPKAFAAGADISEFANYSTDQGEELSRKGQRVFDAFAESPKLTIAAVNGFALGGGGELALACHLRIATSNAKFGQPEVNLGLVPGYGATQRLPELIGRSRALELLLTGDAIDATEAHRLGIFNKVVEAEELLNTCKAMIEKVASKGPLAVANCIHLVDVHFRGHLNGTDGMDEESRTFGSLFGTGDFKEGTVAFLERRKAAFKGN